MVSTVSEPNNPFLPGDVIVNILKRLPVKSLMRFQCVCKDWKNLIKSSSFIQDHLHHSSHQNPSLFLRWHNSIRMQFGLLDGDCDKEVLEVENAPLTNLFFARIVGSSNGLLCVEASENDTYPFPLLLWNPVIREVRKVRRRTIIDFELDDLLGFGFSQVDNDYKIVRIKVPEYQFVANPMEVYSLNSGSWKVIEFDNLEGVAIRSHRNVTVNGVMFWIGGKQGLDDDYSLILSFDLSKEVWTVIPMPDLNYYDKIRLIEYENRLVVLAGFFGEEKSYLIHLWVVEEDRCSSGERWIWTKIFTSSPFPPKLDPVTIWRNEIVFCPFYQSDYGVSTPILYTLNLITNEFKRFPIRSSQNDRINMKIFSYVESLVSFDNINIEDVAS
ncbi:hypothetical protein QN277_005711 [Acacia crassicarpa]|uniref:F-box domain-containing protein n=1 Tax=Acacia crassicarpa TaxID=499986 RepID=A0AAE1IWV0_9FABA|nr:hypothetical protein QN277_005711 [Acacia crassicarpa]